MLDLGRKPIPDAIQELPDDAIIVSHSQLGVWDRCAYKWELQYNQGWVKPPSTGMARGGAIHALLEIYYRFKMENPVTVPQAAWEPVEDFLMEKVGEASTHEDMALLAEAGNLVKRYIFEAAPTLDKDMRVREVEKHFLAKLETPGGLEYYLQVYLDLLFETLGGSINLMDHKSMSDARFWGQTSIVMDSQMPTYAAVLRHLGIEVHNIWFNMFNTYQYKSAPMASKLFKRERTYRTDTELDSILYEIGTQVDEMYHPEFKKRIRRSLSKDCDRCAYHEVCLMGLKGMNTLPFLQATFKRKEEFKSPVEESLDSEDQGE